jgi:hypothetical protein
VVAVAVALQEVVEQRGGRRLAIRAGHARDHERVRGVVVERRRQGGGGVAVVVDVDVRYAHAGHAGSGADDAHGAARHRLRHEGVSIDDHADARHEHPSRLDLGDVLRDARDVGVGEGR